MLDPTTPRTAPAVQLQLHPADHQHASLLGSVDAWAHTLRSDHTRRAYLGPVLRLLEHPAGFSPAGLEALRDHMLEAGRQARTVHRAMGAVIACSAWLSTHGHLPASTPPALQAVPRPQRDPSSRRSEPRRTEQLALPWPASPPPAG
ncbi:unannotated protein [freshwater metagenome]|uniref:Unannotated protein n=1 Tax=freshwater metagenome TaxID=449393 RepID=A0A6J7FPA6_9ZZZZ